MCFYLVPSVVEIQNASIVFLNLEEETIKSKLTIKFQVNNINYNYN